MIPPAPQKKKTHFSLISLKKKRKKKASWDMMSLLHMEYFTQKKRRLSVSSIQVSPGHCSPRWHFVGAFFCCISWPEGKDAPAPGCGRAALCLAGLPSFHVLFSMTELSEKSQHEKPSPLPSSWLLERENREVCVYCSGRRGEHRINLFRAFVSLYRARSRKIALSHCML